MLHHLQAMFSQVRTFLLEEGMRRKEAVRFNPKGEVTREFDFFAEEKVIEYCRREFPFPVRVLTEEQGEVRTCEGEPYFTLMVDPVDGSENFLRGAELCCFSVAMIPGGGVVHPEVVEIALVGEIFGGSAFYAEKGKGAFRDGEALRPSTMEDLFHAIIGCDFNFSDKGKIRRVHRLLERVRDMRRLGTAAGELAMVAAGWLDAHVDVRDQLTPENFIAAYLIIKEAGGIITGMKGEPLPPIESMTHGYSLIASGNSRLHSRILQTLNL